MNNTKRKIAGAIATGALLLNAFTPLAFATTTIEISGNGAGSDNWVTLNQTSNTSVNQNNVANVTNNVDANAKTGGNDANFNTGGDVTIDTGKAESNVDISNTLNSNSAEVECCGPGSTNVTISGNGAKSNNGVQLDQTSNTTVNQNNVANVNNNVDADAKTGGNDAYSNTGGDVTIRTGNAKADVDVSTTANVNSAKVGSSLGGSNPSASFVISGNGARSDNYITAYLAKNTSVNQNNVANVNNNVDADAKTGGNDANFNTGGDVTIDTGDATVTVDVDNSVNFNFADVDCGCTWDVLAKISGNGAEEDSHHHRRHRDRGDNIITLDLESNQYVGQGNVAYLDNNVDGDAKTGKNDVESNTGEVDGDPSVLTGDATSDTSVENSGNVNVDGDISPFDWPEMPDFEFSFNFMAMMAFFGMSL